jgi:hypothetical protein
MLNNSDEITNHLNVAGKSKWQREREDFETDDQSLLIRRLAIQEKVTRQTASSICLPIPPCPAFHFPNSVNMRAIHDMVACEIYVAISGILPNG